jgi:tRNA-dihydrouridine synthase B
MKDELLVARIFRAIVKEVRVPVTVKIRKGWDHDHQNALNIIRIAKEEGLRYVTVHGRTRCQMFHGHADWDFLHSVARESPLPIIGNGDLTTVALACQAYPKVSGIMIGRGVYGRPWFLGQVRRALASGCASSHASSPAMPLEHQDMPQDGSIPLAMQRAIVQEHMHELFSYYGAAQGSLLARKHLGWYSKGLPAATDFRVRIFQQTDPQVIVKMIDEFYCQASEIEQERAAESGRGGETCAWGREDKAQDKGQEETSLNQTSLNQDKGQNGVSDSAFVRCATNTRGSDHTP